MEKMKCEVCGRTDLEAENLAVINLDLVAHAKCYAFWCHFSQRYMDARSRMFSIPDEFRSWLQYSFTDSIDGVIADMRFVLDSARGFGPHAVNRIEFELRDILGDGNE